MRFLILDLCSPLEQFKVINFVDYFNIMIAYFKIYLGIIVGLFIVGYKYVKLLDYSTFYNNNSILFNLLIGLISDIYEPFNDFYIPIFFSNFFFLTLSNLSGTLSLGFTTTAHIVVSFTISAISFIWFNLVMGLKFFERVLTIFLPSGTPTIILPLLTPIECISYVSRLLSLSIRLFANLLSGHTLMHILLNFFCSSQPYSPVFFIPLFIISIILVMEFGVASLQVYVFLVLLSLYAKDTKSISNH